MLKKALAAIAASLCLAPALAIAADAAATAKPAAPAGAKAAASPAAAKPAAKPASKGAAAPTAKAGGKAAPAAAATAAALTAGQLEAAGRVYTGKASCEFDQTVEIAAIDGKPGHFSLKHKASTYTLVPEETTTGAVRLEDKRAGIVWLQIPAKSMLMNAKIGQRVADNCLMAQQRG